MTRSFYQYINEIRKDDLSIIGKEVNATLKKDYSDTSFNDLFGNKTRIVIPLNNNDEYDFQKTLEQAGYTVDLTKGTATSKIQTQRGEQTRTERIGALLGKLAKLQPNKANHWKDMLSWWEKSKVNIGRVNKKGVSIIISRNPIDIVRMSDHDEWTSCHTPGNSFFHCAIQEAKTGGAVAYIVSNTELAEIKNLQAKDIFKDKDRDITGINPLERVRLRRFSDGNISILIPEKRTYGRKHIGFLDAVKDWAKHVQRNKIDFNKPPSYSSFNLHGGSYQDNDANEIWNNFFGTSVAGKKQSVDQKGKHDNIQKLEAAMRVVLAGHTYKHHQAWADVNEDGDDDYIFSSAEVCFKFPKNSFIRIPTEKLESEIRKLKLYNKLEFRIANISIDTYSKDRKNISICFSIDNEEGFDLDGLEGFLDKLDRLDADYKKSYSIIQAALVELEYLEDWREPWYDFEHFKYEVSHSRNEAINDYIESDPILIGDIITIPKTNYNFNGNKINFKDTELRKNAHVIFQFPIITPQFDIVFVTDLTKTHLYIKLEINIDHETDFTKLYNTIKYIDDNWEYFEQRSVQWWAKVSKGDAYSPRMPIGSPIDRQKQQLAKQQQIDSRQKRFPFKEWVVRRNEFI